MTVVLFATACSTTKVQSAKSVAFALQKLKTVYKAPLLSVCTAQKVRQLYTIYKIYRKVNLAAVRQIKLIA